MEEVVSVSFQVCLSVEESEWHLKRTEYIQNIIILLLN